MNQSASQNHSHSSVIRIVCFDLGGVLVRICRNWTEACAHAGLEVRGNSADDELKQRRRDISLAYGTGKIDTDTFFDEVSRSLDRLYSPEEIAQIHRVWTLDEYPGVGQIIDNLNDLGVTTACLSNTNHKHWIRMAHLSDDGMTLLTDCKPEYPAVVRLQHHFASHLIGAVKPDATIYEYFVRAMKAADPGMILFFDDLEENVAAARRMGWRAEQIDYSGDTAAQIAGGLKRYDLLL